MDGNKRTGIVTAAQFLRLNGHRLVATNDELEDFVMTVARGTSDLATMADWFREHVTRT